MVLKTEYTEMYVKIKKFSRILMAALTTLAVAYLAITLTYKFVRESAERDGRQVVQSEIDALRAREKATKEREEEVRRLTTLAVSAMEVVGASMTEHRRLAMAVNVARVAHGSFDDPRHRDAWVALLAIESRFNKDAKSPAGAVGVGQITPPTAKDFWKVCGLPSEVTAEDLTEPLVNLPLSACIFKKTLEGVDGSVPLALAAYNAGRYSKTLEDLKKLKNINNETGSYIAKHSTILHMLESK